MINVKKALLNFSLVAACIAFSASVLAGEKIDETLAAEKDGRVAIEVMTGLVSIKSWDKAEVKVIGELDGKAEGYVFERNGNRIIFKVKMPKQTWGSWKDTSGELTFYVPKQSELRFEGVNVSVDAQEIVGGAKINTVNGDITATKLEKRVELETVNGKITSRELSGRLTITTVNGEIDDKGSQGEAEITTVNGEINTNIVSSDLAITNVNGGMNLSLSGVEELEISTVNGDIKLDYVYDKKGKVVISAVSGEIDLYVPADISARFNIETHAGGDINNKLTNQQSTKNRYGPGESLEFETGSGLIKFEMNTVNGDISILKKR